MKLNAAKTTVMIVDTSRGNYKSSSWSFKIDNQPITTCQSVKLLGIQLNNTLTWDDQVAKMTTKGSLRLRFLKNLRSFGLSQQELLLYYKSSVRSTIEYSSVVWGPGLTAEQVRDIETIQIRAFQIIYGKRLSTSSYKDILLETKTKSLEDRRVDALLNFGIKLLKNKKFRTILPEFAHNNIRLRKSNLLVPIKCNRVRYQKSTIPAVVNLINEEFRTKGKLNGFQLELTEE